MGKILIVSPKDISSRDFEGSQARIFEIAKFLSKKNSVDLVCLSRNEFDNKISFLNKIKKFKINFFLRIINTIIFSINLSPMQNGFFYSKKMKDFISDNKDDYDTIICHLLRCAQYLPKDFEGKKILEMTDFTSTNYEQAISQMSFLNPLKYIYFIENFFVKKYERKILKYFDEIVLISDKEISDVTKITERKKVSVIGHSCNPNKNIFVHNSLNYKISFIGNINYLPNKIACYKFSRKILPVINKEYPNVKFNIIGKINYLDKLILSFFSNVVVCGPIKNPEKELKKSICGMCNVNIATGLQSKIFYYMSYGLPVITSKSSYPKRVFKKNKEILVYKNDADLVNLIFSLIKNKKISNRISNNGFNTLKKKYKLSNIYRKYEKII